MMMSKANVVNKQHIEQRLREGVVSGQRCEVSREKHPEPTVTGRRVKEAREAIKDERGRPLSIRALAEQSGVGAGVISRIESGATQHAEGETLKRLAPHLRVSVDWLLETTKDAVDATPVAPPVSETRVVDDAVNDLLNEAFDHNRHEPSDILLVGEALRLQAPLLKSHVEPLDIVRALLDTAADARLKGKRLKAEELPVVALGTTKRQLVSAEERIAQFMAQGDREAALLGVETRDTPHPLLVQQVDRMMGKKPSNKGNKSGKSGGNGARGQ